MSGGKLGGECSSGAWKEVWAEIEWIWGSSVNRIEDGASCLGSLERLAYSKYSNIFLSLAYSFRA